MKKTKIFFLFLHEKGAQIIMLLKSKIYICYYLIFILSINENIHCKKYDIFKIQIHNSQNFILFRFVDFLLYTILIFFVLNRFIEMLQNVSEG